MGTALISRIRSRLARLIQPPHRGEFTLVSTVGGLKVELTDSECDDVAFVRRSLLTYNAGEAGDSCYRNLNLILRDEDGHVVGGLLASTYWQWLCFEFLWIEPAHRKGPNAISLFVAAEQEAMRRGCQSALLDTYTFQGRVRLYELLGYKICWELDGFPPGHRRVFMKKTLNAGARTVKAESAG